MKVCLCVLQCPTRPGTCNCHVITARTGRWRCPGALLTKDTASSESILWVLFICIKLNHSKDDYSSDTDITSCMLILPRELVQLFHIFHSVLSLLHSYTSSLVVNCLSHSSVSALTQSVCVFCVFVSVCFRLSTVKEVLTGRHRNAPKPTLRWRSCSLTLCTGSG